MVRLTAKGEPEHPAKFSPTILRHMGIIIHNIMQNEGWDHVTVLDPNGGVGRIHQLKSAWVHTHMIEIEPEWCQVGSTLGPSVCMDMFDFYPQLPFNIVATSITYGNRMADHHNATDLSKRNTYKHVLERDPDSRSSAILQWGDEYRAFHLRMFTKVRDDFLVGGGYFVLNIKDHVRKKEVQKVSSWCWETLRALGFTRMGLQFIPAKGNREGENGDSRVPGEWIGTWRVES